MAIFAQFVLSESISIFFTTLASHFSKYFFIIICLVPSSAFIISLMKAVILFSLILSCPRCKFSFCAPIALLIFNAHLYCFCLNTKVSSTTCSR